jgi:hypothetical protein
MKDKPYTLLVVSTFISFIIPAFCLRIAERPLMNISSDANDFNDLTNCLWVIIITLTSVGYGDMSPVTNYGKIIGINIALFGVFTTSMMVVTLENTTKLEGAEKYAYTLLTRLKIKEQLQKKAVLVLEMAYLYRVHRRLVGEENCQKTKVQFRTALLEFKQVYGEV